MLKRQF